MNAEEKLRVARLVTRLARAPETPQDEDAALELAALLKVRPDAPYLLMQRTLMLELALERAQAELEQLRQGSGQAQGNASVLPATAAGAPARPVDPQTTRWTPGVTVSSGAPAGTGYGPGYGQPVPTGPAYGPGPVAGQAPSGAGSFLRNAAAVGAGVLGGSLLFHGLDSLFHDHGHQGGHGGGQGLLSGDMQSPLDAISGNSFLDPGPDPLAGGSDLLGGDMLGDGSEFDSGEDDWA
jgi:hypothetical protein